MGNLTPKPISQQVNKKFSSKGESATKVNIWKDEVPQIKNKYKNEKIKNNAPNWVQKNIRYAASTHLLVFAKLYKIKKDGTNSIS